MKKALSLILAFVVVIAMIPMAALPAFAEASTASNDAVINVYDKVVPSTDSTGVVFSSLIGTTLSANTTYKLMENIDLSAVTLDGTKSINLAGGNVIDGQGHSITGIAFKSTVTGWCQLFNANAANGTNTFTIKNVQFGSKESPITFVSSGTEVSTGTINGLFGLIKGTNDASTLNLENLSAYVNTSFSAASWCANGVFVNKTWGYVNFKNCTVDGSLGANGYVGAFIGSVADRITTFTNCVNYAAVSNTNTDAASGFVGRIQQYAGVTFTNCVNNGNVSGSRFAGGFIGIFEGSKNLTITNCVNNGNISNAKSDKTHCGAGGFLGSIITTPDVNISGSVNKGQVKGYIASGGFVGYFGGAKITVNSCVNEGYVSCEGRSGGAIGAIAPGTNATVNTFFNKGTIQNAWTHAGSVFGAVASGKESASDVYNVTLKNVINVGEIKSNEPGSLSGYLAYATITIDNCINTGTLTSINNSKTFALFSCRPECVINSNSTADNITNLYLGTYENGHLNENQDRTATLSEILTALNANNSLVTAFGPFASNAAGTSVVLATPEYEGYQIGLFDDATNTYSVRLVATINDVKLADPCEYTNIGFDISVNGNEFVRTYAEYVYTSVQGSSDGKMITYTAADLGGSYLYALKLNKLSTATDYTLTVRTYAIDKNGVEILGDTYTINLPATTAAGN